MGPNGHVIGAVSGGVDSSVAAVLLHRAIGDRFHAVMVDNGCLRKDEAMKVVSRLKVDLGINLTVVDAADRFLDALEGVIEPETKRKIIGSLFIEVFQEKVTDQFLSYVIVSVSLSHSLSSPNSYSPRRMPKINDICQ